MPLKPQWNTPLTHPSILTAMIVGTTAYGGGSIPETDMAPTPVSPSTTSTCTRSITSTYKHTSLAFMHTKRFKVSFSLIVIAGATVAAGVTSSQYNLQDPVFNGQNLPSEAVFPGPWDQYIQAPADKTHIRPKSVKYAEGDVSDASSVLNGTDGTQSLAIGPGGIVIFEFGQNIGGR